MNVDEGGVEKSIEMEKEKFFLSNDDKICLKGEKGEKMETADRKDGVAGRKGILRG